ncbi:MAG TPA: outer membrane lipoprotein-sorting protein [Nitrospinota bacterium]|nr:outer membrane lipoprotein-sorting protein [Nitrospinota bacterium]
MNCCRIPRQKVVLILARWMKTLLTGIVLALAFLSFPAFSKYVQADEKRTGRHIMNDVFKRHEMFPYVFEEQTMILMDNAGNRDVKKMRRFSRVEKDETVKYLLVFDNPLEVNGVALLAINQSSTEGESRIYLPALGKELKFNFENSKGGFFLGTDFAIEDLTVEVLSDFRYVRVADQKINNIDYYVVEAFPQNKKIEQTTGYSLRRHFIQPDIFFIVRTDYFDRRGRFLKRETKHDLKKVDGDMWRANMILMENQKERHKTLIKVNRRIFSHDYVPAEMFTSTWLLENRHILGKKKRLLQDISRPSTENDDDLPIAPEKEPRQDQQADFSKK